MNQQRHLCGPFSPSGRTIFPKPPAAWNRYRDGLLAALCLTLGLSSIAAAGPALEYGPEAEAGFLARCTRSGATAASCQHLMEQLQAQLGYAVFIELAAGGPEGFGRIATDRHADRAPTIAANH
jgi:hypothetical protein